MREWYNNPKNHSRIRARLNAKHKANPEYREKMNKLTKKIRDRYKIAVLEHYGGKPPKCACCGEDKIPFLSVDHINGGGSKERKITKRRSNYDWLVKNDFPKGFQILCMNCNWAKGIYGKCPHKEQVI